MVSRSSPPSLSTSGSVELLDDIEEDLVSLSSLTSSKQTVSTHGPARFRSASLQDLPRPVSCPTSLWSRSRDSGVPLSGSCPSMCSDLLAVVTGLRAELCERDETIHVLHQSYVALLETCASLENTLDQARLCSACASRRMLEGSCATLHQEVPDVFRAHSPGSHSPVPSPPREKLPSNSAGESPTETEGSDASRESCVCSDIPASDPALSKYTSGHGETSHKKEERFARTAPGVNGETESQQDSRRTILLKDEGMQELLLCCLDAVHVAACTSLQRSQMLRSSLMTLSHGCPADIPHLLPT